MSTTLQALDALQSGLLEAAGVTVGLQRINFVIPGLGPRTHRSATSSR